MEHVEKLSSLEQALLDLVKSTEEIRQAIDRLDDSFNEMWESEKKNKLILEQIGADEISALF